MASPFGIALVACSLMAAPIAVVANDLIPSIAESAALRIGAGRVTGDDEATAVARALGHLRARAIPASDLQYLRSIKDLQGVIHVRFAQRSNDLPVLGGHIIVHLQNDGTIRSTDWYWRKAVHITPIPAVTLHEAITAAAQPGFVVSPTRSELSILPGEANGGSPELVWRIISRRNTALDARETVVNAHTGRVIATAHVSANGYSDVRLKPMYTSRTEKWVSPTRMDAPESYYYTEYGCFAAVRKASRSSIQRSGTSVRPAMR